MGSAVENILLLLLLVRLYDACTNVKEEILHYLPASASAAVLAPALTKC